MNTLKPLVGIVVLTLGVVATLVLDHVEALGPLPRHGAAQTSPSRLEVKPATPPVVTPAMRTELEAERARLEAADVVFTAARERFNAVIGKYRVVGYRLNLYTLEYSVDPYYREPLLATPKPKENK